jgi:predicted alpha/beta hydrolase family esterase
MIIEEIIELILNNEFIKNYLIYILSAIFASITYFIRKNLDKMFFFPNNFDKINFDNSCEIYKFNTIEDKLEGSITTTECIGLLKKKQNSKRTILIVHGNAGSIYGREELINLLSDKFDGDIYCMEYPGFGDCSNKSLSISNCILETKRWIKHLNEKYNDVILYGESIGCAIIIQTINNFRIENNLNYINKINKIYLPSGFTSIKDIIFKISPILGNIYNMFMRNDLNTFETLPIISTILKNKKIYFIHSINDEIIPFEHSNKNYEILIKFGNKNNIYLIKTTGGHNSTNLSNIDKI